ncbi:uncharacterized protein LOC110108177 [Dendrobium catenatum]|uniref:Uncharacterized protein n=1 Tax=Dendrobium catenatum TaxID=906689 RepID=A0A2I0VMY8_9ASPA|nr:uncharacterized protein LOC110108177 [Dendrobium catenatum]XP_028556533.1 uncharacterized protein LOC110108177 [Dendrobium catenatum]XP_028556534.1 uncharacterized protein LOC110108177 [Dendrobium catenatum]XP_028556535.1 uncharacterized protein LOC110108177 [Dendrobium catenatum]PKU64768.1 hypothetical protein MA16_Dca012632 [Dendrobium catenatum]
MLSNSGWNRLKFLRTNVMCHGQWKLAYHFHDTEIDEELAPQEWYRLAYAKLVKLSYLLKNVEHIDGKLISVDDNSIINDVYIINQMKSFNSLARTLISAPSVQCALKKSLTSAQPQVFSCFSSLNGRQPMTLDSLTKICNFLGISAQQRKSIRLTVCPQVTQHHIWRGALEEILNDLKRELDNIGFNSPAFQMARQVMMSCLKFLKDTASLHESEAPAWMRLAPLKKVEKLETLLKWEEVLEMFVHLSQCMSQEERLLCSIAKIDVMKEGLYHIKDIVIERDISFKEARRQDSLVQKKLTKSLGHSSKCLFTLLLYYLYGTVRDIEVEVCGGVCGGGGKLYLQIGKFLTSDDEKMVRNGVKQLYRALGVFKFVWETASMDGTVNLQGHIWSVGANERTLTYRGNKFFVHNIIL